MKLKLFTIICCSLLFSSCFNLIDNSNKIKNNKESEIIDNSENAYVTFSLESENLRAILPGNVKSQNYTYELTGIRDNEPEVLGSWMSYYELWRGIGTSIEIGVGDWTFILCAKNEDKIALIDSVDILIQAGENSVSFNLAEPETGTGAVNVVFNFPRYSFYKVTAGLYSLANVMLEEYALESLEINSDSFDKHYVLYDKTDVPAGDYFIKFFCYQNRLDTEWINVKSEYVHIAPENLSKGEITISSEDVNTRYSISYDTGKYTLKDHVELETIYNSCQIVELPSSAEDFVEENIYFPGWRIKGKKSRTYFTELPAGTQGNIILTTEIFYKVSVSELENFIQTYEDTTVPVYITDSNPDLTIIKEILLNNQEKLIDLNISGCLEITAIQDKVFYDVDNLNSIILPDSIISMGERTFNFCENLRRVILPANIDVIPFCCFSDCHNLNDVIIPDSVAEISDSAFSGCEKLTGIKIPSSVTYIGDYAFYATGLLSINIPDSVTVMGKHVFSRCLYLKEVYLSANLTRIDDYTFSDCWELQRIIFPTKLETIGEYALLNCKNVLHFSFPSTLRTIETGAFCCCIGNTITVPSTVTTIGVAAFQRCTLYYSGYASGSPWKASYYNGFKMIETYD